MRQMMRTERRRSPPTQTWHSCDMVIAIGDINGQWKPVADKPSDLESHFLINKVAPILLFQATLPLLEESAGRFFIISLSVAFIGIMCDLPLTRKL